MAGAGALVGLSVLVSRATGKVGVPLALAFLVLGMLAGSEGIAGIAFENYGIAFRLGTVALTFILFDGGLNTPVSAIRRALWPATLLATLGVVGMALLAAVGARMVGFTWPEALLLGAIVSSTDAAAVFSVLRGSGLHLKRRVGTTLELESGVNDPMAVILTMALTRFLLAGDGLSWSLAWSVVVQLVVGGLGGLGIGWAGRMVLARARLTALGMYPVLTLSLAAVAFGVPTLFNGSGFLAVYVAGVVLSHGELPNRSGVLRVHDALAWLCQIGLFLMLGLLAFPSRLLAVMGPGLALGLFLAVVGRPLVVVLCLLPFNFSWRERLYVGWVGLRGAVPIVLATFPVMANAPGAHHIFDVVFFVVVLSAVIPGATLPWVTRWMGLESTGPPAPPAILDISSVQPLSGQVLSFFIEPASAVSGVKLADIPFPPGASVMLVVRGRELAAPRGTTQLLPGDHVYVISRAEDVELVRLMFGRQVEG